MRRTILVLAFVLLAGCAAGNRYNYRGAVAALPIQATAHDMLILAVEDLRPYVLSGEKSADFVGLQRGGFGNPFDVTTASGAPLTDDMAAMVASSLRNSGYEVVSAEGKPHMDQLARLAQANNSNRIVWLKVREWKSDIYMSIGLTYDLQLAVYDASGTLLGENALNGHEAAGGGKLAADKNSQHMAQEFARRIGYLFNGKSVRNAL